jgi:hypothetical protein
MLALFLHRDPEHCQHRHCLRRHEGGQNANTQFTQTPGFLAQAPEQKAPAVVTAQTGQAVRAYVTQSSHGTWLFPPHQGGNG